MLWDPLRAVAGLVPVALGGIETEISKKREVNMELNVKLDQLAYLPVAYPDVVQAEEITGGPRGNDGYGSTGR